jgi:hypothetical protein
MSGAWNLPQADELQILPTMLNLAAIRREVTIGLLPGTLEKRRPAESGTYQRGIY